MSKTMRFLAAVVAIAAFSFAHAQAFSDYTEVEIVKHIFRTGSFTKPTVLAVALGTACSDASFTELANSGSYARVTANPADGTWAATNGTNGLTSNVSAITFPAATADWNSGSTIGFFGVFDSATYGAGNLIFCAAITTPRAVVNGSTAAFGAGALTFTIQ